MILAALLVIAIALAPSASADPNALWTITHDQCVPDEEQHADPAPCALVDLPGRYVVLKDLVGRTQFLLIPTDRVSGIESPEILAPDAPDYFAAAWRARTFVEQRAGQPLPRDWVSLAINSVDGRSQNQLHIHVDCVRADVRDAVLRNVDALAPGPRTRGADPMWVPFPELLAGHQYLASVVPGENLDGVNPFVLLADGVPGARTDMGPRTLFAMGVHLADGSPGFVLLSDRADPATGNLAESEELQDHDVCPPLRR
jgi:CDP-diacylglycerol pyrophosphatase